MFYPLLAAVVISLISFSGAFALFLRPDFLKKIIYFLVALSAGTLLGTAFLHILPEVIEKTDSVREIFLIFIGGFSTFFLLERLLSWHHCHKHGNCEIHPVGMLNLIGDAVHNLFDGILIAVAFSADFNLGMVTTIAIIMHEIPQELGDFGVLIHAGYSPKKALFLNFVSALFSILGVIIGYFFIGYFSGIESYILSFIAGGFLYISASDLVPELHNEKDLKKALISFVIFLGGIFIMYLA